MPPIVPDPTKIKSFPSEVAFEKWLSANHAKQTELWLRIYKKGSGVSSVTNAEAIDVALCWGWIDGIRKGLDEVSFLQRYTPRTKKSPWSQINVANVERLTQAGKMQPSGLAQVEAAKADGRWQKAYRMKDEPPADLLAAIRAEPKALAMYETLTSQNRFALTFRTLAMKTATDRAKKIATFAPGCRPRSTKWRASLLVRSSSWR